MFIFLSFVFVVVIQLIVYTLNWCKTDMQEYTQVEYFYR